MGLPGRHPADLCLNKGEANCHNCGVCNTGSSASNVSEDLVSEITKKVLASLGK